MMNPSAPSGIFPSPAILVSLWDSNDLEIQYLRTDALTDARNDYPWITMSPAPCSEFSLVQSKGPCELVPSPGIPL